MNKSIALTVAGLFVAGAAIGAYRSGVIGTQYAEVVSATPIIVKEEIYGEVVAVTAVTETRDVAQQVCENRQVQSRQPERFGNKDGAVIGAVVGGLIGNQIGKGDGRKLATVAGAVGGGYAGREIDRRHEGGKVVSSSERVCRNETAPQTSIIGYDVQYRSDGLLLSKRVDRKPGERLLIGERDRVIGYDVAWRYRDLSGSLRLDHAPGERLPIQDGVIVANAGGSVATGR